MALWFRLIKGWALLRSCHQGDSQQTDQDRTLDYKAHIRRGIVCVGVALYAAARLFIIVECGIDMAHLPDSAFKAPQWSRYFPHVS